MHSLNTEGRHVGVVQQLTVGFFRYLLAAWEEAAEEARKVVILLVERQPGHRKAA